MRSLEALDYEISRLIMLIPFDWIFLACVLWWAYKRGQKVEHNKWKLNPTTMTFSREEDAP